MALKGECRTGYTEKAKTICRTWGPGRTRPHGVAGNRVDLCQDYGQGHVKDRPRAPDKSHMAVLSPS